jgi:anti-sigma regulatory factor (Ser/Thr protein kinase)
MNSAKLSLVLKNDLTELENLGYHIQKFCKLHGLSKKNTFELNLVLDEVFTNIVSYGLDNQKEHLIKIDIQIMSKNVTIRIEDHGKPFDPTAIGKSNLQCSLEDRQIGGLGLHLINHIMSSIIYKRTGDKNVLILTKKLDEK